MKERMVAFMPHPPVLINTIGGGKERDAGKTISGLKDLSKKISEFKPDTIVMISPHGNCFQNGTCILHQERLKGSFSPFGFSDVGFEKEVNLSLSEQIERKLEENGLIAVLMDSELAKKYKVKAELDHGVMVPMHFIDEAYTSYKIVHIAPGFTSLHENYQIGQLIAEVIGEQEERVLLLCSGDLSHALRGDGPYSYHPDGPVLDELVKRAIEEKDPLLLLDLTDDFLENAAQCGIRSFLMGFGYLDGLFYEGEVLSYEGPFGVGYLTGMLKSEGQEAPSLLDRLEEMKDDDYQRRVIAEDDTIRLARATIEFYVRKGRILEDSEVKRFVSEESIQKWSQLHHGTFVSLHKNGRLRGCIGTISEVRENLMEEIMYNAISACSSDPRFDPVTEDELKELEIKVDILHENEQINSVAELDVKRYGVIVEKGNKRGLLLPNLEGIDTVEEQVDIALQKAGIKDLSGVTLYRFEVERHEI